MRKFSKIISLICVLSMMLTVMPVITYAAFSGDEVTFDDYSAQNVTSYLTNKGFMVVSNPLSISDEGANGKMLHFGRNGRVVRWYDPTREGNRPNITDDFTYEFTFMQKTKSAVADIGTISCSPWNAANYGFQFSSDGANLVLKNGTGTDTVVANYEANTVYTVKILVKLSDKTLRIWINGEEKLTDKTVTFLNNINHVSRIDFNALNSDFYIGKIVLEQYIDMAAEVVNLGTKISEARATVDGLDVGDYLGQYPQSAVDKASAVIDEVEAVYDGFVNDTPDDIALIEAEKAKLNGALAELLASVNSAYVQKYSMDFDSKTLAADSWNQYQGNSEVLTLDGNKVLYASKIGSGDDTRVLKVYSEPVTGMAVISFSIMQEVKAPVVKISEITSYSYNEPNRLYNLSSDGTNILINDIVLIPNYNEGQWYDIQIETVPTAKTLKVYVDGERMLADTTISHLGASNIGIGRWETSISAAGSGIYIDNIEIKENVITDFEEEATALEAIFGDKDSVVNDIELPLSDNGFEIEWSSDDESVITSDGKVTRSEDSDKVVNLTALISRHGLTSKKVYTLTVPSIVYASVVDENFELYIDGEYPLGWTITSGSAIVREADGNKAVSVSGKMTKNAVYKNVTPAGYAEVSFMQNTKAAVNSVMMLSQSEALFNIRTDGTNIIACYGDTEEVIVENYEAGKWYSIRAVYNLQNKVFCIYIDGEEKLTANDIPMGSSSEIVKFILDAQYSEMFVDNISFGTAKISEIEIISDKDTVLRPASGEEKVEYKVLFKDENGKILAPAPAVWTVKNESGEIAENILAENNCVTVTNTAETGRMTVTAALKADNAISDSHTLNITAQGIKEIVISGTSKITRAGDYNYTAEVISEYGVVLPSDGIVWSVDGNASIDENGKLKVNSVRNETLTVKATLDGVTGTFKVKLEAPSTSGGGGGGGFSGGGSLTASPVEIPEVTEPDIEEVYYNDVPQSFWASAAIYDLSSRGILSGDGTGNFLPNEKVSRAQFAKMIAEAFSLPEGSESKFTDADKNAWYYSYVNAASSAGIINGYPDGRFGVDDAITRQDAAVMLHRALNYKNVKCETSALSYSDNDLIASYAKDAVGVMLQSGIMSGRENNNFVPEGNMTRAEAATVFYRILGLIEGR